MTQTTQELVESLIRSYTEQTPVEAVYTIAAGIKHTNFLGYPQSPEMLGFMADPAVTDEQLRRVIRGMQIRLRESDGRPTASPSTPANSARIPIYIRVNVNREDVLALAKEAGIFPLLDDWMQVALRTPLRSDLTNRQLNSALTAIKRVRCHLRNVDAFLASKGLLASSRS